MGGKLHHRGPLRRLFFYVQLLSTFSIKNDTYTDTNNDTYSDTNNPKNQFGFSETKRTKAVQPYTVEYDCKQETANASR